MDTNTNTNTVFTACEQGCDLDPIFFSIQPNQYPLQRQDQAVAGSNTMSFYCQTFYTAKLQPDNSWKNIVNFLTHKLFLSPEDEAWPFRWSKAVVWNNCSEFNWIVLTN